jgi:alkylation response protein AidB-like acyl-CoA dehydrogenase
MIRLTEPNAGSDFNSKTNAVLDGNEWVINGSKIFITNAATRITSGVTVWRVPECGTTAGRAFLHHCGSRHPRLHSQTDARQDDVAGLNTAELYFEDCRVLMKTCWDRGATDSTRRW